LVVCQISSCHATSVPESWFCKHALAPKSGTMTEEEATSWANALHRASDQGVFFGASNYYTYIARRAVVEHLRSPTPTP
jgi:hypothetical protein